jgi:hypothetical protein
MKPIGEVLKTIFGKAVVPEELTTDKARELLAAAEAEQREAKADLARKSGLCEETISTAALDPENPRQQAAVAKVSAAERKAQERLRLADALVRGSQAKLAAAEARERAEADQVRAAEIRATAARQVEVGDQVDAALDVVWVRVREFQQLQLALARGNRDVMMIMVDPRQLIESRLQSRFGGTTRLVGFGMMGRNIAATACEGLPKPPAVGNGGAETANLAPPPGGAAARAET